MILLWKLTYTKIRVKNVLSAFQFDETEKDDFSSTNESSNNTDSSTGESMLHRASYIPYPASNSEVTHY